MKIITLNINGIRAGARAGFFDWVKEENPDIICLQEIKAMQEQLTDPLFYPEGYHCYFSPAEKKGYSGVAIYTKHKPHHIQIGLGFDLADKEGRYIQTDFGDLSVISVYFPSGTSSEERQQCKYHFMEKFTDELRKFYQSKRHFIICGDWNIAHTKNDIKNWRGNQKNSGFLPEERAWLDQVFGTEGFVDAFRVLNQELDQYTWWSNRGQAFAKNVGWRIDYQVITPALKNHLTSCRIYKERRFSDHAPVVMEYDFPVKGAD